ncbi:MAG TPA: S4 domain-containing protein, partial [candidate division Zixibacteria bacterium]|nr:S4 domain-containing protein [candidate division Zixibacteria bacterium]
MSERTDSEIQSRNLTVTTAGERLDKVLAKEFPDLSRSQFQKLISAGMVTVNGQVPKASQRMEGGELIEFTVPESVESELVAESIPLDIRYEDEDIIILN